MGSLLYDSSARRIDSGTAVRAMLVVAALLLAPREVHGQFNLPIPRVFPTEVVLREDVQILFALDAGGTSPSARHNAMQRLLPAPDTPPDAPARMAYEARVAAFCKDEGLVHDDCVAALSVERMHARMAQDRFAGKVFTDQYLATWLPLVNTPRSRVARYLRRSGIDEALSFATQFGANLSEDEAYVASNVVKGLAGRALFSTDYAFVVTRADTGNAAKQDTLETDQANALRAINNGGTLVGRFTIPMYAAAGGSSGTALGVTLGGGFIGPVKESQAAKQSAVGTASFEGVTSIALRNITGTYQRMADLIIGLRSGYTLSERPLLLTSDQKGVAFAQLMVGIRQSGNLSLSALVTVTEHAFEQQVPTLMLNMAATR